MRPYLEKTRCKKMADGVTQGVGPEFKPQYCKKKKKSKNQKINKLAWWHILSSQQCRR
jgi:hypothetical protein